MTMSDELWEIKVVSLVEEGLVVGRVKEARVVLMMMMMMMMEGSWYWITDCIHIMMGGLSF